MRISDWSSDVCSSDLHAPGFAVLEAIARQLSDDIWVCAPSEEQSGAGHSLTLSRPVRVRQHGTRRWSCTGTPTDSVMVAIGKRSEEHTSELQSLMRISYAVFCLKKKTYRQKINT